MRSVEEALITLGGFGGSGFTWIDLVLGGVGILIHTYVYVYTYVYS
jgi:hypothetical protein